MDKVIIPVDVWNKLDENTKNKIRKTVDDMFVETYEVRTTQYTLGIIPPIETVYAGGYTIAKYKCKIELLIQNTFDRDMKLAQTLFNQTKQIEEYNRLKDSISTIKNVLNTTEG